MNTKEGYSKKSLQDTRILMAGGGDKQIEEIINAYGAMSIAPAISFNTPISGDLLGNASTADRLKNSRTINGIAFDGSSNINITYPYGFSSFTSGATWGDTTGTSFASWNDSTGGSIDFRRDNPSSGKMSIKVDGRVYVNEGLNPCLSAIKTSASGSIAYWGMRDPDGGDNWIRTTTNGLIPYCSGGSDSGHSLLGTSSWYFSAAYILNIYGYLNGNISGTAAALTNLSSSDNASSTATWRKVWISYNDGVTGRPTLSSNFAYQTSTNTLKTPNITSSGNITSSTGNIDSLTAGNLIVTGASTLTGNVSTGALNAISLKLNGTAVSLSGHTHSEYIPLSGKDGTSSSWINGRSNAILKMTSISGYSPTISIKTNNGSWEIGAYAESSYADKITFSFATDTNFNAGTNTSSVYTLDSSGNFSGKVNWNNITSKPSSFTPSSHNHGLSHSDFYIFLNSTTTNNGWNMLDSNMSKTASHSFALLKAIRTDANTPDWILGNYSAGIAFGGADTKGVISVAYDSPSIKFAGGNSTEPVWLIGITGTTGTTYALNTISSNASNGNTAYGWGNHSGLYLPLTGGTISGNLSIKKETESGKTRDDTYVRDISIYGKNAHLQIIAHTDANYIESGNLDFSASADLYITGKYAQRMDNLHLIATTIKSYGSITPSQTNSYNLGTTSYRWLYVYSYYSYSINGFYQSSDIRLKNVLNYLDIQKSYDFLESCRPFNYELKSTPGEILLGVSALEVELFYPEIVSVDEEGFKSVQYDKLAVILLEICKDLNNRLKKLENV